MQIIQCRPVKGQIPTHHLSSLILDSSCKSAGADPRCLRRVLHTPQISHWVIVGSTQTGKLSSLTYWPMHNLELSREPIILKFGLWEEARQTQGEHAKSIQKGRGETSLQPSCCKVPVNAPLSVKLSIIAFSVLLHINLNGGSRQDHLILFCMVVNKSIVSICHFDSQKKQAEMLLTLAHFTLYPPIIHFLAHCQHPPKSTVKDAFGWRWYRQPESKSYYVVNKTMSSLWVNWKCREAEGQSLWCISTQWQDSTMAGAIQKTDWLLGDFSHLQSCSIQYLWI